MGGPGERIGAAFSTAGGLAVGNQIRSGTVVLPPGNVVIASGPMSGDKLPTDTTAWIVRKGG